MIQLSKKFQKAGILSMLAFSAFGAVQGQQQNDLAQVNTIYDEQHPVLADNGDLYFSVGFHPRNMGGEQDMGDVWMSRLDPNGGYAAPVQLKALSTKGNDVVVGFLSPTELLVYHDGRERKQGIHQYVISGNDWQYDRKLEMGNFRTKSPHFSGRLHSDGKTLVMTLESFGSYGNEDIYVSFRNENGSWSSPQNLGPTINTHKQEMTPSLSKDARTLFFSSNGHGGEGGRNVFYAQRLDDSWENWSAPVAVNEVNSKGVELGYVFADDEGTKALYTSTQNSEGFGDILVSDKVVELPAVAEIPVEEPVIEEKVEEVIVEEIKIEEKQVAAANPPAQETVEEEAIEPEVEETIEPEPEEIIEEPVITENTTSPKPLNLEVLDIHTLEAVNYKVLAKFEGQDRELKEGEIHELPESKTITVRATGYFPVTYSQKQMMGLNEPILLTPAAKGSSIVLDNIWFKRGTSDLSDEESMENIEKLASFLQDHPEMKVRIEGHTDNLGDPQLNKELSMGRAGKIRNLLVEKGIAFERIRVSGWGGTKPVASNQTEEGRNKNRRVELVIEE